ncbi:unnamed protein product [Ixodes pacificus]
MAVIPIHGPAQARAPAVAMAAPGSHLEEAALAPGTKEVASEAENMEVAVAPAPLGAKVLVEAVEKVDGTLLQAASLEEVVPTPGTNKVATVAENSGVVAPAEDHGLRDSLEELEGVVHGLKVDLEAERNSPDPGTLEASEVQVKAAVEVLGRGLKAGASMEERASGDLDPGLGQEAAEVNMDQALRRGAKEDREVDMGAAQRNRGLAQEENRWEARVPGQGKVKGVTAEGRVHGQAAKPPEVELRGTKVDMAALAEGEEEEVVASGHGHPPGKENLSGRNPFLSPTSESSLDQRDHGIKDHMAQGNKAEVGLAPGTAEALVVERVAVAAAAVGPGLEEVANIQEDLDHGLRVVMEAGHLDLVPGTKARVVTEVRRVEVEDQVLGMDLQIMGADLALGVEPAAAEVAVVTGPARVLLALVLGLKVAAVEVLVVPVGMDRVADGVADKVVAGMTASKEDAGVSVVAAKGQELVKSSGALAEMIPGLSHRRGQVHGQLTDANSTHPPGLGK